MRGGSNTTINNPLPTMHLGDDHAASHSTNTQPDASALYRRHWPALCSFARAKGCESHDAEDAVQELFARLVEQGQHERAARIADHHEQAAFLMARLRTHLIKRWRYRTRLRRGGGVVCFSLSDEAGREIDVADAHPSPDREIDRDWARNVIDCALGRIRRELQTQGRGDVWRCLEGESLDSSPASPQNGAMRVALHRARKRLRGLIREQFQESDDEHVLLSALG